MKNNMVPVENAQNVHSSMLARKGNTLPFLNIFDTKTYTADIIDAQTGKILYYWFIQAKSASEAMLQLTNDIQKETMSTHRRLNWNNFAQSTK